MEEQKKKGFLFSDLQGMKEGASVSYFTGKITHIGSSTRVKGETRRTQFVTLYNGRETIQVLLFRPIPLSWQGYSVTGMGGQVKTVKRYNRMYNVIALDELSFSSKLGTKPTDTGLDFRSLCNLRMEAVKIAETFLSRGERRPIYSTWHIVNVANIIVGWVLEGEHNVSGMYNKVEIPSDIVTPKTVEDIMRMISDEGFDKQMVIDRLKLYKKEFLYQLDEASALKLINSMRKQKAIEEQEKQIEERRKTG